MSEASLSISIYQFNISNYSLKFQSYFTDFPVEKVTEVSVACTENSKIVFTQKPVKYD